MGQFDDAFRLDGLHRCFDGPVLLLDHGIDFGQQVQFQELVTAPAVHIDVEILGFRAVGELLGAHLHRRFESGCLPCCCHI